MAYKLFHPLEFNHATQEPYLRLLPPHENIILTPSRLSDVPASTVILNDPRVHMTLLGPPYPYTEDDARSWLQKRKEESDQIMDELREGANDEPEPGKLKLVSGCPVNILRELQPDGTEVYLGDISFTRCRWSEVKDDVLREGLVQENEARKAGDPAIVWELGGM